MARSTVAVKITGDSRDLVHAFKQAEKGSEDFGRKVQNDLSILADWGKKGAVALGAIVTTVAGVALKGGIDRLMGLERANRQLKQLGVEGSAADRLMDSLLQTMLGTPFALDKGAASLAGFVASGRDLEDIPRLINQVTDAAAFGNTTLEDTDFIWQRIQTTGRVTNEELRMLAERNIPVYTQLAGAFDTTAASVFDMASNGELSADMFFDAWERAADGTIDGTVRIAGAAKSMGETTEGAWDNMRTAMSRFGATVLENIFPLAKEAFAAIGEGFDRMGEVFKRVGAGLDTSGIKSWIADIPDLMEDAAESVVELWQETQVFRDVAGLAFRGVAAVLETKLIPALAAALVAATALYAHPVIAGIGLIVVGIGALAKQADEAKLSLSDLAEVMGEEAAQSAAGLLTAFDSQLGVLPGWMRNIDLARAASEGLADEMGSMADDELEKARDGLEKIAQQQGWMTAETELLAEAIDKEIDARKRGTEATKRATDQGKRYLDVNKNWTDHTQSDVIPALEEQEEAQAEVTDAVQDYIDTQRAAVDPIFGVINAQRDLETATDEYTEALGRGEEGAYDAARAAEGIVDANVDLQSSLHALRVQGIDPTGDAARSMFRGMGLDDAQIDAIFAQFRRIEANAPVVRASITMPDIHSVSSGQGVHFYKGKTRTFTEHGGIARARPGGVDITTAEAGSDEAIIPLNRQGVDFLVEALKKAGVGGGGGGPRVLKIYIDSRQIAEALIDHERTWG